MGRALISHGKKKSGKTDGWRWDLLASWSQAWAQTYIP